MRGGTHIKMTMHKARVHEWLLAADRAALEGWLDADPRASRLLQRLLFDPEQLVAWRAVEAIGLAATRMPELEKVRELLRRTLWLMNDESGGLLWRGPEVVGSVLARSSVLAGEFGPLLPGFVEQPPFCTGACWALWRLSSIWRDAGASPVLLSALRSSDAALRGHAALALRATAPTAPQHLEALEADAALLTVFDYRAGLLQPTTVGAVASGRFA